MIITVNKIIYWHAFAFQLFCSARPLIIQSTLGTLLAILETMIVLFTQCSSQTEAGSCHANLVTAL